MWSEEQSLELISLYQERPVIWNPKNPKYYRKNLKNDAWKAIALSLGRDVEDCKAKMISLLASYRREKGKIKSSQVSGKGTNEIYKSNWFAYEAFEFLRDRSNPRKRKNIEIKIEAEGSTGAENTNTPEFIVPICQPPEQKNKSDENKKMETLSEVLDVLKSIVSTHSPEPPKSNANNFDDETVFFSNFICSKMQKYDQGTKNAVQRAIMNIIFKADEGYTDF